MSQVAGYNGNASEELASIIRDRIQAFCEFFKTSQFDKMAQFYSRKPAPNQDANPVFLFRFWKRSYGKFVQDIETHHVLEEYKGSSFFG